MNTRKTAVEGENAAVEYLKGIGYGIIERNYRCPAGEIDVVARDNGIVVFVEVKTRNSTQFGMPEESVSAAKRRKILLSAKFWISAHGRDCKKGCRFDIVSVLRGEVRHIVNAFDADCLV